MNTLNDFELKITNDTSIKFKNLTTIEID